MEAREQGLSDVCFSVLTASGALVSVCVCVCEHLQTKLYNKFRNVRKALSMTVTGRENRVSAKVYNSQVGGTRTVL